MSWFLLAAACGGGTLSTGGDAGVTAELPPDEGDLGEPDPEAPETVDAGAPAPAAAPAMRFDLAALDCGGGASSCPASDASCLCPPELTALDYDTQPHFLAVTSDMHRDEIAAAGNEQAVWASSLDAGWAAGGVARASAMMTLAGERFPSGVPAWFLVGTISVTEWPGNATYRQFVVDFARAMEEEHGRKVVIISPFPEPGRNADAWTALEEHAWIAAQVFLSGADLAGQEAPLLWARAQYQQTIDAYATVGVSEERLLLVEHFGNTLAGEDRGRAGASVEEWLDAIATRADVVRGMPFAGFVSLGWAQNQIREEEATRLAFEEEYALDAR